MLRSIGVALLTLGMLAACGQDSSSSAKRAEAENPSLVDPAKVDAALRELVDSGQLVGVSALVYERGREVYFGAFGAADREANRPMRRDALARIFSMTKPITGVALMRLHDQGKFQLDDPVSKYAPEFASLRVYAGTNDKGEAQFEAPHRDVTIRDLMRHTAGLGANDDPSPVGEMLRAADPLSFDNTLTEMAQKLGQVPLLYQPGTRWLYSPSVDVQAFLVERLSGEPFDEYLRKHIFEPLRMTDTRYVVPSEDRDRLAVLYARNDDGTFAPLEAPGLLRVNEEETALKPGGWGLVSTLDDYMRFSRMLLNEGELDGARILSAEAVRLMKTNAMPTEVTDTSWLPSKGQVGFGIDFAVRIAPPANRDEASGAVGEFFWDGLANTLFWVDPANEITAVLFTQYIPFGRVPLHKAFRDAIYEKHPEASSLNKPEAPSPSS